MRRAASSEKSTPTAAAPPMLLFLAVAAGQHVDAGGSRWPASATRAARRLLLAARPAARSKPSICRRRSPPRVVPGSSRTPAASPRHSVLHPREKRVELASVSRLRLGLDRPGILRATAAHGSWCLVMATRLRGRRDRECGRIRSWRRWLKPAASAAAAPVANADRFTHRVLREAHPPIGQAILAKSGPG
jgi:hypothetical protein